MSRRQPRGLRIDEIEVGESYVARWDSGGVRYEVLAIEKVPERLMGYGPSTRNVRMLKVRIWRGETVINERHIKASQLNQTWAENQAQVEAAAARKAEREAAGTELEKVLLDAQLGGRVRYDWRSDGGVELLMTPIQARRLAEVLRSG